MTSEEETSDPEEEKSGGFARESSTAVRAGPEGRAWKSSRDWGSEDEDSVEGVEPSGVRGPCCEVSMF